MFAIAALATGVFVHYAAGCTMMESFYQAIRCPLQIVLVGDPLAQPWAPKATVKISGLGKNPVSGSVKLDVSVESKDREYFGRFVYLLDGRIAGRGGKSFVLDTTKFQNGQHLLRVVACRNKLARCQAFIEKTIVIANEQSPAGVGQEPAVEKRTGTVPSERLKDKEGSGRR